VPHKNLLVLEEKLVMHLPLLLKKVNALLVIVWKPIGRR